MRPEPNAEPSAIRAPIERAFAADRALLFGLLYRMLGSRADAEDLLQESFIRVLDHPPPDLAAPLRPYLVKVAMNLAKDALRRRRRQPYQGVWLPGLLEDEASPLPIASARYELMESVSLAFLLALEALTPTQRGVLILRDVADFSVRETAEALGLSEVNVRTSHGRARRAMKGYDAERRPITAARIEAASQALFRLVSALQGSDAGALQALLAGDVTALSDGGGVYLAALRPILGAEKVARFFLHLSAERVPHAVELRQFNGLPALVLDYPAEPGRREAPRAVLSLDVGEDGTIRRVYSILAPRKLPGPALSSESKLT